MIRNYKQEYAARVERAKARGYASYPQERKARVAIKREVVRLKDLGVEFPKADPRTKEGKHLLGLLETARRDAKERKLTGVRGAKERLPESLKVEIRKFFTDPKTGKLLYSAYNPFMRSLYP